MDDFIDIVLDILTNLNVSDAFRKIRKRTENKFLRGALYLAECTGSLLFALILAAAIFLLYRLLCVFFGIFA